MANREGIPLPADSGRAALLEAAFVPGEAPFRIKGNAYRGHIEFVAQHVPGGLKAHNEALTKLSPSLGPAWAEFFDQKFLPSVWYDCYPLAVAGLVCSQLTGEEFLTFVARRTAIQAQQDMGGIYRFLLKFVSAKQISLRVPGLLSRYFDFVESDSKVLGPNSLRVEVAGAPLELWPWLSTVFLSYIGAVVEIAGRQAPHVELSLPTLAGESHGIDVCLGVGIVTLSGPPVEVEPTPPV